MRLLNTNEIPPALFEIPQPPKKLYIEGTLPPKGSLYLAVVGSRKYTSYGRDVVEKLMAALAGYPIVIVSGLALGIDTLAHENALKNNLQTVAFPGSGLDPSVLYPRANGNLAKKIVESGGCLISEFEPKLGAAEWTFPTRNRLMAGLCRALLVIEAEEKSGTLITARLATEYNRDVLAVPGSIFSPSSLGTNSLIRQGATPITNANDILQALGFEPSDENIQRADLADCAPEELALLEILNEPLSKDELIRRSTRPAHEIQMTLSIMEIKGLIKEELGEIRRV